MSKEITIKRRFAVMLEDAITVTVPDDFDKDDDFYIGAYDDFYVDAQNGEPTIEGVVARISWEDQHHCDLDFPDDEYVIERSE